MNTKYNNNVKEKKRAIQLILILGVLILGIKFLAYFKTGSTAILSDALESLINIVAGAFALFSIIYSSKLKDEDHPYGHGKMEYVAVGFEGALIFTTGIVIIGKSLSNLFSKHEMHEVETGMILTVISGVMMFVMGTFLKVRGKKLNSQILIADGKHLIVDVVTSAGLVAGLLAYKLTNYFWIDSVMAMVFAIHITWSGFKLVKQALDTLLDKADVESIEKIAALLQSKRRGSWIDIHNLRLQKFGDFMHVDCHVTMPYYESLEKVHDEIKAIEKVLVDEYDNQVELFVHTDPCEQLPCRLCKVTPCAVRRVDFEKEVIWTATILMQNKKHEL